MHGVQVFNNNGEQIFSSENEYLKVLRMGEVTINSRQETKILSLEPQKIKPKLFASGNYYYLEDPNTGIIQYSYIIKPMLGNLNKDSDGNYVSFEIGMESSKTYIYNQTYQPIQPFIEPPWVIPYVVFI